MREEILHGPLTRSLLKLAWPTATTAALNGLVAAVDVIMVGRLGETAVAAVTASRQATMVLLVAGSAIAVGGGALVAQATGRGDKAQANHVLTQSLLSFFLALALILIPFGWVAAPPLLEWLVEGNRAVVAAGVPYMRVVICSSLFTLLGFAASAGIRGAGDTKTPLRIAMVANGLNIPFNALFIFGIPALGIHGLGVVGAAWGTALARGMTNLVLLGWLFTDRLGIRFTPVRQWRLDLGVLVEMARIGVPASLSSIVLNLNGLLLISILARTPAAGMAVAGYGLANVFRNFGTWMTWGLSDATMAMVGQNIGARQRRRARASGFAAAKVATVFLTAIGLAVALLAPLVLPLILDESDPERKRQVIAIGVAYLWSQAVALPFLGVGMTLEGALRGAGDSMSALLNNIFSLLIIGLPAAAFLALDPVLTSPVTIPGLGLGTWGVWLGLVIAMLTRGLTMFLKWRRVRWRRSTG